MAMQKSWDDLRADVRAEGVAKGKAEALLTVLSVRGIAVPDAARVRILAETDLACLGRWLQSAVTTSSIDDVLGESA
jgi:hypothetical protein